jgi:tetratricopeptide (TPR) repeat protein
VNRPTTLPGTVGGNRPGIGGGNRPTTLPGDLGGNRPGQGGGNRPGLGGDRPGFGGNRPTPLPGDLGNRPGGNRPGIGGNRPTTLPGDLGHWNDGHRPNRPGIGGNRPGIGNGNNIWNNGNWNSGNFNNNNFNNVHVGGGYGGWGWNGGGGWGYPGYGGGYGGGYGWNNGWHNNGWVNPHYGNWYNGGWGNNWGYNGGGWWAPFVTGAATWGLLSSIGSWGLGYSSLGYGSAGYVNPYYSAMPAAVVASSPYDYSQPVIINNYIPADAAASATDAAADQQPTAQPAAQAASPADAAVDAALGKFKAGDYAGALAGFDQALKISPKDSVIHEVRALSLFALGRYTEAAAALNAVLATAPGMDWTTMSNVYGSVDAYTGHLRTLEEFCRTHPDDAAAHFVLGYHYLVGGHTDMAAAALRVVVAKQPGDVVAKRLLDAVTPAAEETSAPAADTGAAAAKTDVGAPAENALPETDLVGTWKATSDSDTVVLTVTTESAFTWKAQPAGKPAVELKGTIETSADAIALVSESAGTMVAKVTPKTADSFEFALPSAPKDAKPLVFTRQP